MKKFSPQALQDIKNIPTDIMNIILDFEKFVDEFDSGKFEGKVNLTPKLPHTKRKIRSSIATGLKITRDEKLRKYLLVLGATLDVVTSPELLKKV